jgi:hypothetical protein
MQMSVPIPYFEAQGPEGNHCGIHAINMHAGGNFFFQAIYGRSS